MPDGFLRRFHSIEFSILIGVAFSILLFVPRAARLRASELEVTPQGLIRERQQEDPPNGDLLIYDLEGELFFGAAPELERCLDEISQRTQAENIRHVILRLKGTRNSDVVSLEHLEHFLRETLTRGVTVLLAGVRSDLAKALQNLHFHDWFPVDRIFPEEAQIHSATYDAVRHAYHLMGKKFPQQIRQLDPCSNETQEFYYLI